MTAVVGAVVAVLLFLGALRLSGVVPAAAHTVKLAQGSLVVLRAADIDEDEKEQRIQRAAIDMFRSFASVTLRGAATLVLPFLVLWGAEQAGFGDADATIALLLRWEVILGLTVVGLGVFVWRRRH